MGSQYSVRTWSRDAFRSESWDHQLKKTVETGARGLPLKSYVVYSPPASPPGSRVSPEA